MEKISVKEAIVVEGRDDTIAINRAVEGITIETHGFGIRKETWDLIEKAYKEKGIIVFTDPDFSGEEIRKKILARFPEAKEAFLSKNKATKKGDIGIENAEPEDIIDALKKAKFQNAVYEDLFNNTDLEEAGLAGGKASKERRERLGEILGIGYGNSKALLKKLNKFGVEKEDFYEAIRTIDNK